MSIRILLVEDHKIVREGTRQLLEQSSDLAIVGEAARGDEAIHLTEELHPDVIVMDVRLPGMSGIEATQVIKSRFHEVHILILSAYDDDRYVFPLLQAGANGYLLKTASAQELAEAIRYVHSGGIALDPHIADKVVNRFDRSQGHRFDETQDELTRRELEVLNLAGQGKSNKAIAKALSISLQTVQVHLRNIFTKLRVSSRSEATALAIKQGIIVLEREDE